MIGIEQQALADILDPSTPLGALLYAVAFLVVAAVISSLVGRWIKRAASPGSSAPFDRTSLVFVGQLVRVAVFIIAAILYFHLIPALRAFGTALLTTASVASIVVGLAAQNTLGNLIAGTSLLLYRPMALGDEIEITAPSIAQSGTVTSLTLGHTILQGLGGEKILVPNSLMATSIITNRGQATDTARD